MTLDDAMDWLASAAGKPQVILGIIFVIGVALILHFMVDAVNIAISIISLAVSLAIIGKQDKAECRARLRDEALHLKIDELIGATENARNELIGSEEATEQDLQRLKASGT